MFMGGYVRNVLLILADLICVYGIWSFVVCGYWAVGLGSYDPLFYLRMWPVGFAFVFVNVLFRLYHGSLLYPSIPHSPVEEMRRLVGSSLLSHLLVIAYLVLAYQTTENYSRLVIVVSGFLVAFSAQLVRDVFRGLMWKAHVAQIPAILLGNGRTAELVEKVLAHDAHVGFRIVRKVGSDVRSLLRIGRESGVRTLVVCQDFRLFRAQADELSKWYLHVEYIPMSGAFPVFGSRVISFGGVGGVEMVNQGRMKSLRMEKWLLDKSFAVFAMLVFSPVFLVLAVLIKLTSHGPVFYRQHRLGRFGRPIRVWKFRSMYADADERLKTILAKDAKAAAEWKANFKLQNDPRITPLGKILRKTSMDELPQLFNVFAGDMAIVGPRPIVEDEVAYYGSSYDVFSSVLPGITGLWQASGRSDTDYDQRVALDVQYVLNWSPWLDIWIIIKTFFSVVLMRGAC